jgi:hypothetical protein
VFVCKLKGVVLKFVSISRGLEKNSDLENTCGLTQSVAKEGDEEEEDKPEAGEEPAELAAEITPEVGIGINIRACALSWGWMAASSSCSRCLRS